MQRRSVLKLGGLGVMSGFFANPLMALENKPLLGFSQIPISTDDDFKVPAGYSAKVLIKWGDKMFSEAKGDEAMKTAADPKGELVYGTLNNCGCGKTPWGTYLTCEENFDDFFGCKDKDFAPNKSYARYGIKAKGDVYEWHKFDDRFDYKATPNEANRFGWVVEIDPFEPNSTPKKRTALGRFKHENCEIVVDKFDNVVAYSGDDENNEFVYKFVAKNKFDRKNPKANTNILEFGTLYVAKFNGEFGDFKGDLEWVELSPGKHGLDKAFKFQADILIRTREAATMVGATPMDSKRWRLLKQGRL